MAEVVGMHTRMNVAVLERATPAASGGSATEPSASRLAGYSPSQHTCAPRRCLLACLLACKLLARASAGCGASAIGSSAHPLPSEAASGAAAPTPHSHANPGSTGAGSVSAAHTSSAGRAVKRTFECAAAAAAAGAGGSARGAWAQQPPHVAVPPDAAAATARSWWSAPAPWRVASAAPRCCEARVPSVAEDAEAKQPVSQAPRRGPHRRGPPPQEDSRRVCAGSMAGCRLCAAGPVRRSGRRRRRRHQGSASTPCRSPEQRVSRGAPQRRRLQRRRRRLRSCGPARQRRVQ